MAATAFASGRADQIYRTGPEVLIAESATILAGPVSSYSKQILTTSEPAGPSAVPTKWVVTGRLENPSVLKGTVRGSISFSRSEQSIFIPGGSDREAWEAQYGDLGPTDEVVVFLSDDSRSGVQARALPSGTAERNLAALVQDIVAIQALAPQLQESAWLSYLERGRTDEGRQAALRSLVKARTDWSRFSPALDRVVASPISGGAMRGYAFGIVVFGLTGGLWTQSQPAVGGSLCRQFASEGGTRLLLEYILKFKLLLQYTMEEAHQTSRASLRGTITDCLRSREASLSRTPELAQQYQQIRAAYPSLL